MMGTFEVGQRVKFICIYGEVEGVVYRKCPDGAYDINVGGEIWTEISEGITLMPSELAPADAPAQADAGASDFYAEFARGWDMATRSMIDILERALNAPVAGDRLSHLTALVQNFRKEYPKHAESAQGDGGE